MVGLLARAAVGAAQGLGEGIAETSKDRVKAKRAKALEGFRQGNRREIVTTQQNRADTRATATATSADARAVRKAASDTARSDAQIAGREKVARISAQSRRDVAARKKPNPKDATSAQDRIIARHTVTDDQDVKTIDHESAAVALEADGHKNAAAEQRRMAKGKADLADQAAAEVQADLDVEDAAGTFSSDASDFKKDGGSRTRFRARRVREIKKELKADREGGPKPAPKTPPEQESRGAGTTEDPFRITTQAEFDVVKIDEWYINPADNKIYQRKK